VQPPDPAQPSVGLPARHELYVYYRAPEAHATALREAVDAMQSGLITAHSGLQARLLRRPCVEDGQHTWMEVYQLPEAAEPEALAASIEHAAQGLLHWARGPRHVEHFIACAS
jgi:hypothetical protein